MPVMQQDPRQQEIIELNAQRVREAFAKYRMPAIRLGRQVAWYPTADKSYGNSVLGWVTKVENQAISITLMGEGVQGEARQEVPHISDPRLSLNSDWRGQGAWDYAEEEGSSQVTIDKLVGDLKRVSERVQQLETEQKESLRAQGDLQADLETLQRWADTLGVAEDVPPEAPAATPKTKK